MIPPLERRMYQVTYRTRDERGVADFIAVVPALTLVDAVAQVGWQLREKHPVKFVEYEAVDAHRYHGADEPEGAPA